MESKNHFKHIVAILVALVPLAYLLMIWNTVPQTVALHFGTDGTPDRMGDRTSMLWSIIAMTAVSLITYAIVVNVHKLDKKRTKGVKPPIFDTIALVTVIFLSFLNLVIILSGIHHEIKLYNQLLIPAIGLFFIFLGNVFYNIKPNRFVGIRVPWTLNNEDNWKYTHRFGAKLFFVGGLLITLVSLGYETTVASMFMSGIVLVITAATVLYSYIYYRNTKHNNA